MVQCYLILRYNYKFVSFPFHGQDAWKRIATWKHWGTLLCPVVLKLWLKKEPVMLCFPFDTIIWYSLHESLQQNSSVSLKNNTNIIWFHSWSCFLWVLNQWIYTLLLWRGWTAWVHLIGFCMGSFPCEGPFFVNGEKWYITDPPGTLLCLCPEHPM